MIIQVGNFYDTIGASQSKRYLDEESIIENQGKLADRILQIASEIVYSSQKTSYAAGDIISFHGDSLVACFPGEVYNL